LSYLEVNCFFFRF